MREYSEYSWTDGRLYYGLEYEGWSLIPHETYDGMWYILTPDGVSYDFYNIQRAKDNAVKMNQSEYNQRYRQRVRE